MEKQIDKEYKPANPIRTFLGVNNRQLAYRISSYFLGFIGLLIFFTKSDSMMGLYLAVVILFFLSWGIYYLKNRSKIIADYKVVQIKGIPLRPDASHDFPLVGSIVAILCFLFIMFSAAYFPKVNDFYMVIINAVAPIFSWLLSIVLLLVE